MHANRIMQPTISVTPADQFDGGEPAVGQTLASATVEAQALEDLGLWLIAQRYDFVAITPASHARNAARWQHAEAVELRDIFGWSRPFRRGVLPSLVEGLMQRAGVLAVTADSNLLVSRVRFASLDEHLFVHSQWPTNGRDAVFFGPDTYRFARFVRQHLPAARGRSFSIVDVGCGSGAVGLLAKHWIGGEQVYLQLLDINPVALAYARVNARMAQQPQVCIRASDLLKEVEGHPDLIICNPPYLPDSAGRAYRDGGGVLGSGLSLRLVREALEVLAPGGVLLLYTGTAVIGGQHVFATELLPLLQRAQFSRPLSFRYREIDPDVFGEELDMDAYGEVERIAVVGLVVQIHGGRHGEIA